MDLPDGARKQHGRAVSRLGGLPIFITLLAGTIYMPFGLLKGAQEVAEWWPLILCQTIVFSVGFADDLKPLGARVKLMGQIGAASLLYTFGFSIDVLTHPTTGEYCDAGLVCAADHHWLAVWRSRTSSTSSTGWTDWRGDLGCFSA